MNINEFRDFVLFVAKKAQSGANPTPSQFNLAVQRAFYEWLMSRYGNPQQYSPKAPFPKMGFQETQKISDDLGFLITRKEFNVAQDGKLSYPDGVNVKDVNSAVAPKYLHASSMRSTYGYKDSSGAVQSKSVDIKAIKDFELGNTLASSIVTPTSRYPVYAFYDTYMQFHPKDIQRVEFTYLREPTKPVWAYTLDANNRPVYDSANSVDIESGEESMNEIAFNTLAFLGVSIRDQFLVQASETFNAQGV